MVRSAATIALAATLAFSASAAHAIVAQATFTLATPIPIDNCTIDIPIQVTTTDSANFGQFVVNYTSTCASFDSVRLGSATGAFTILQQTDGPGTAGFPMSPGSADRHVLVQITNQTGTFTGIDQQVLILRFNRVGPTGTCDFLWDGTRVEGQFRSFLGITTGSDIVPEPAGNIVFNNTSSTGSGSQILGNSHYYDVDTNHIANVHVRVVQGSTTYPTQFSDTNGDFVVPGLGNGPTKVVASRTVDTDHKISIGGHDCIVLFNLANGAPVTPDQRRAADVNTDGAVDITDAQFVSAWLAFLPGAKVATWTFDLTHQLTTAPDSITFNMDCADDTVAVKGFFRGDVDSTWAFRNPKAERPISIATSLVNASWDGDVASVTLSSDLGGQTIESLLYSLDYDRGAFEYLGATTGASASGALLVDNGTEAGRVHGALLGVHGDIERSGPLAVLRFRAKSAASAGRIQFTRLRINDRPASDAPELMLSRGETPAGTLPQRFDLTSSPNPFNPTTRVEYSIPADAGVVQVSVRVFDIAGRLVRDLVEGRREPGLYQATWDGKDAAGNVSGTGIYFVRMQAGTWSGVHKVTLLK